MQHEITIICDDIRTETGNKITLVGLYDDAILVARLPARLGKLCVFQRWTDAEEIGKVSFEVRGQAIGDTVISVVPRKHEHDRPANATSVKKIRLLLTFVTVDLVAEGRLEFHTYLNDQSASRHVHTIDVRIDPGIERFG